MRELQSAAHDFADETGHGAPIAVAHCKSSTNPLTLMLASG